MEKAPLVYAIGLGPCTVRAVCSDLAGAEICRLSPLGSCDACERGGAQPDLVLLNTSATDVHAELAAAREAWGDWVTVVGISSSQPLACVWGAGRAEMVELGPGFLEPFLP